MGLIYLMVLLLAIMGLVLLTMSHSKLNALASYVALSAPHNYINLFYLEDTTNCATTIYSSSSALDDFVRY